MTKSKVSTPHLPFGLGRYQLSVYPRAKRAA
nr:MAG TPA: hypothetical protein [Caudoviricetes sp.]